MQSKYTYDNSSVLINLFDIRDEELLNKTESKYTYGRMVELEMDPRKVINMHSRLFPKSEFQKFSKEHYLSLHAYILQDVYPITAGQLSKMGFQNKKPWVGTFREENIAKDNFRFADARFVAYSLEDILTQIKNENFKHITDKERLAEKLAHYMAELNVAHVFRETNGRTTREFIREIALEAGFDIDWSVVREKIVPATIVASIKETTQLKEVIMEAMVENNIQMKTL